MEAIQRFEVPVVAPEFRVSRGARSKRRGSVMREVAVATYDVSGGDDGTAGAHGTGVYIPANAIITSVWYDVVTTFTSASADAGTIAVGYTGAATAFTAAIAISDSSNVWDAGVRGAKIGNYALDGNALTQLAMAAGRAATFVKLTAEKEIIVTTATQTITAGKMNIFVEYFVSD